MNRQTSAPDPTRDAAESHRILIVDDRAIQETFRNILTADPSSQEFAAEGAASVSGASRFELEFASRGEEALEKVIAAREAGLRYSVVFMSARMPPGWDGIETTARLWEEDADVQVVICTDYSDHSWEEMIARLGMTDRLLILKKPFGGIEVLQCAHALTGKWSLVQRAYRHAESLEATVNFRTAELESANLKLENEIAERRRSEEALRLTQFSVDHASDAIFWSAPDGRLLYVNAAACRTLGYTEQELRAMNVAEILPSLRGDGLRDFWHSLREAQHRTFETRHLAKDGREIPIELTANFFNFGGQELLCASARDITKRKKLLGELFRARDAALESVRLKGQFLANMSHEICTPMNGVIGMAELLVHTNLGRAQRDYVDTIRSSADILLGIINNILDSSRIEAGNLHFEVRDFDLREVVKDALDAVAGVGVKKGLELVGCINPEIVPHLRGDAGRIGQVLTNLVNNAVKFTEAGKVTVTVSPESENVTHTRLRFEIRDTGIGIPAAARDRIFEPFIQVDGSDTRKYGGTGLGLTICRQIVEALGGEIGVESQPGRTTFWFTLEFKKGTAPATPASPATRGPACPADLRVLVVDDNATNRNILKLQLANLQMRSEAASGGREALELLRRGSADADPFQIAILDMQMPEMDGLELAGRIKADPAIAGTRLLILTSLGRHLSEEVLSAAGVENYLVKPLKQSRLQDALASLLSRDAPPVPAMPAAEAPPQSPKEPRPSPLRILLAEDSLVNQKVALLQLKRLGYTADLAQDGAEALKAMEKDPYDVVLMDCQMPVMDGYAAAREIRRLYDRPIRIIAMTANAMQGDREKCLAAGMDHYLSKPVRTEDLRSLLEGCKPDSTVPPAPSADRPQEEPPEEPVDIERLREITAGDPEVLRRLSHDYLEQADEILACMVLAIERRSPTDISQLAHRLGGSSASCGMRSIVAPLRRLEQIREVSQLPPARDLHQEAIRQLTRIRRFLIAQINTPTSPRPPE